MLLSSIFFRGSFLFRNFSRSLLGLFDWHAEVIYGITLDQRESDSSNVGLCCIGFTAFTSTILWDSHDL